MDKNHRGFRSGAVSVYFNRETVPWKKFSGENRFPGRAHVVFREETRVSVDPRETGMDQNRIRLAFSGLR